MRHAKGLIVALAAVYLTTPCVCAHPILHTGHDRIITLHLHPGQGAGRLAIKVSYRLDEAGSTALQDLKQITDEIDPVLYANKAGEFYDQYTRIFGDILARNLQLHVNDRLVPFQCTLRRHTLLDETTRERLGHLRCTFEFTADVPIQPDAENVLQLRDTNFYNDQEGVIHFTLVTDAPVKITEQIVPDPKNDKQASDSKLRTVTVRFRVSPETGAEAIGTRKVEVPAVSNDTADHDHDEFLARFRDLMESGAGLLLILLVFAGLGAAHALTPGHGKTLVAAYLVGEHGTIWHALILGVVTTITHTGVVLIIAAVLYFLPESMSGQARQSIQTGLGLLLGLSVTCLGIWLLLQRLSGRADHIHLGGGHDHHHHGPGPASAASTQQSEKRPVSLTGLIILGMHGGLIPCWDAVAILAAVAGSSEFWLALPALLAFSAGLAGVLVAIGILVVKFRSFAGSRWGEGRFVRMLPLISALLVTGMGIFLSYSSLRSK